LVFIKRLLFWNHISNCFITLLHFGCRTSLSITSMLVSSGSKPIFATWILSGRSFLYHKTEQVSKLTLVVLHFYFPKWRYVCILSDVYLPVSTISQIVSNEKNGI
jgi:hypothetical protein